MQKNVFLSALISDLLQIKEFYFLCPTSEVCMHINGENIDWRKKKTLIR